MKKLLIIMMLTVSSNAFSQSYYDVLKQCIEKSPQMRLLKANMTADSLSLRRGLNPLDPEVEVEYYFDNDVELKVVQQFDFPTLYHQRNMISKKGINKAKIQYDANLRALLLEVGDLYQQFVYGNQLVNLMTKRNANMVKLSNATKSAFDKGQITAIENKKISLLLKSSMADLNDAKNVLNQSNARLLQMGIVLDSSASFERFNFNGSKDQFVDLIMINEPLVEMLRTDSLVAKHELSLARQEWIPKFNIGYKASFGKDRIGHGIMAGISLPLWQNRNNVKHSKAKINAQSVAMENMIGLVKVELETLYDNYIVARRNAQMWNDAGLDNYEALLYKSVQSGTVNAMEYLLDLSDWQLAQLQMIEDSYKYALYGSRMAVYFSFN